jgi:hypothetical protein
MNGMGKEWVANKMAVVIKQILTCQRTVPISLEWKGKSMERIQLENERVKNRVALDKDSKRYMLKTNHLSIKHMIQPKICSLCERSQGKYEEWMEIMKKEKMREI